MNLCKNFLFSKKLWNNHPVPFCLLLNYLFYFRFKGGCISIGGFFHPVCNQEVVSFTADIPI